MAVAVKQKRIADIALMLEEGMETKTILRKLTKAYGKSISTFEKEIKSAKEIVNKRNAEKEAIRQSLLTEEYKNALNEAIISDIEIEAILCKLVTGNMQVSEMVLGIPVLRDITPTEIIQAAKTLYTKRGSNAPTRQDLTTNGKEIGATQVITLSNGQTIDIG